MHMVNPRKCRSNRPPRVQVYFHHIRRQAAVWLTKQFKSATFITKNNFFLFTKQEEVNRTESSPSFPCMGVQIDRENAGTFRQKDG
jgi:hypothetical protein